MEAAEIDHLNGSCTQVFYGEKIILTDEPIYVREIKRRQKSKDEEARLQYLEEAAWRNDQERKDREEYERLKEKYGDKS